MSQVTVPIRVFFSKTKRVTESIFESRFVLVDIKHPADCQVRTKDITIKSDSCVYNWEIYPKDPKKETDQTQQWMCGKGTPIIFM